MFFSKTFRSRLGICITATAAVALLAGISIADEHSATVPKTSAEKIEAVAGQQAGASLPLDRMSGDYIRGYASDSARVLASPANWDTEDWLKAGLLVGVASGLYLADGDIKSFAQRNQSPAGNRLASAGNALGNPLFTVPSLGLFYLYGHLGDDPKARRASLLAVESLTISGVIALTLKQVTQRPRPFSGESSTTWGGPGLEMANSSFPSIHAQSAFSIATVVAEEYGSNRFVPPLAYGLATCVGLSRIYDNKHWASDVFSGAAIGYFVGKAVVGYHKVQNDTALQILPTFDLNKLGLRAEYRF